MKKTTKIWLIIATSFILVGSLIFGGAMIMLKWDFSKLSTAKYVTNSYDINEGFKNITIDTDTADILFVASDYQTCKVVCYEQENIQHSVNTANDTLVIKAVDNRKWYEYIGINFKAPKITVHMPIGDYGALAIKSSTGGIEIPNDFIFKSIDISESTGKVSNHASATDGIKIKTSTGSICVENVSAGSLDLSASTGGITVNNVECFGDVNTNVSTGKTNLIDVECKNLTSNSSTGSINLSNVVAIENFSINTNTGDVSFEYSDASQIFMETNTGDVSGSLLTEKVFITQTDTGSVDVPKTVTGGRCEITTDTGNIKIDVINSLY